MKTINMKQKNVIQCDCGCAIEYEHSDFVLCQTDDSGDFLAVCVVCPECGCMHIRKPAELVEGDALLDTFKGAKPVLADSLENYSFKEIKGLAKEGKVRSGMCKTIVLKDGSTAVLEVLGVEHDYLPDGGKASVTFGFRDLFGTDDNGGYGRWWWLRSPYSGNSISFCNVSNYGSYNDNYARDTGGVSPCFAI